MRRGWNFYLIDAYESPQVQGQKVFLQFRFASNISSSLRGTFPIKLFKLLGKSVLRAVNVSLLRLFLSNPSENNCTANRR